MKAHFRSFVLLLSFLSTAAVQRPAVAEEPADADALFKRGVDAMEAGNFASGCKDIAESRRLKPLPGTLFTLATCNDKWGHVATAVALYEEYLAAYDALTKDRKAKQGARQKVAKERREKLKPDVPELTLTLPPNAPTGTQVKRDGQEVPMTARNAAFPVDPGEVVITTQAPGGPVSEQRITISKGEKKSVTLDIKPAPTADALSQKVKPSPQPFKEQPPSVPDGMSDRRKAALAIGGVGVAGLALGAVMGGLTLGEKGTIEQHCGEAISAPKDRCDPTGLDAAHRSRDFGLASTIGFAVGGAGLGAGLVLFLTGRATTPAKSGEAQRWITAEVLPAGADGAIFQARGTF